METSAYTQSASCRGSFLIPSLPSYALPSYALPSYAPPPTLVYLPQHHRREYCRASSRWQRFRREVSHSSSHQQAEEGRCLSSCIHGLASRRTSCTSRCHWPTQFHGNLSLGALDCPLASIESVGGSHGHGVLIPNTAAKWTQTDWYCSATRPFCPPDPSSWRGRGR